MADKDKDEKKIIIDEDWKEQAQKEKEELAKEAETEKDTKEKQEQVKKELPAADFSGLVSMLTTQAFFALGLIRTEEDSPTSTRSSNGSLLNSMSPLSNRRRL